MLRLPTLLASALSLVLALALAGSASAQTNNVTSLYGTWTSGTGAVVTGPVSPTSLPKLSLDHAPETDPVIACRALPTR